MLDMEDGILPGWTFEELPDVLTRAEVMELAGISAATFTRRCGHSEVDRRRLSDRDLARFGTPWMERQKKLPRLYPKRDALTTLTYVFETHQHLRKQCDPKLIPYLCVAEWTLRTPAHTAKRRREELERFHRWAEEHELARGGCVFRSRTVTVWAARWVNDDGLPECGWYRREKSARVWSAAVIRHVPVPTEIVFRAIPSDEWEE